MDSPSYLTRSINIRGVDGNDIRISETAERREIVISIQQNDEHGRVATVLLNAAQFDALCRTRYDLHVTEPAASDEIGTQEAA